jgi:hypothetical protein
MQRKVVMPGIERITYAERIEFIFKNRNCIMRRGSKSYLRNKIGLCRNEGCDTCKIEPGLCRG